MKEQIRRALRLVMDPEVGLNIVDLGLIYDISVKDTTAHISMTMTSAACPMHSMILHQAESAVRANVPDLRAVVVELVWEPAWTPARMSEEARTVLGWDA